MGVKVIKGPGKMQKIGGLSDAILSYSRHQRNRKNPKERSQTKQKHRIKLWIKLDN